MVFVIVIKHHNRKRRRRRRRRHIIGLCIFVTSIVCFDWSRRLAVTDLKLFRAVSSNSLETLTGALVAGAAAV